METYVIDKYPAFKNFKNNVGSINQYLITSIIGIRKIDNDDIGIKDPAPWSPNNVDVAKNRAEIFVREAGLTWAIDCLDSLLKDFFDSFYNETDVFKVNEKEYSVVCLESGISVCEDENTKSFENIRRGVYYKFAVISRLLREESDLEGWRRAADYRIGKRGSQPFFPPLELVIAFVDMAIQWRNRLVHNGANNVLNQNTKRVIKHKYRDLLNTNEYGTLEVDKMFKDFELNTITFKELAVLIRSIIDFGYILNAYWINAIEKNEYIIKILDKWNKKAIITKLKPLLPERRKSYVIMSLRSQKISLKKIEADMKSIEENAIEKYIDRIML